MVKPENIYLVYPNTSFPLLSIPRVNDNIALVYAHFYKSI